MIGREVVAIIDFYSSSQIPIGREEVIDFSNYLMNAGEFDVYGVRIKKAEAQSQYALEYHVVKFSFDDTRVNTNLYLQYYETNPGEQGYRIMPDYFLVNKNTMSSTPYQDMDIDFISPCRLSKVKMGITKTNVIINGSTPWSLVLRFEIYKLLP